MNNPSDSVMQLPGTGTRNLQPMRWHFVSAVILLAVLLVSTFMVRIEAARPGAVWVIGGLAFVIIGITIGYLSPGKTIKEAALIGVALGAAAAVALLGGFRLHRWVATSFVSLIAGPGLAVLGAWVGETMQGTLHAQWPASRIRWPWVGVGTVLGLILANYTIFLFNALMDISPVSLLLLMAASLFSTGIFVGAISPGVTLKEPALAGAAVILLETVIVGIGLRAYFPFTAVLLAMAGGFLLALLGGWIGEVLQGLGARQKFRPARVLAGPLHWLSVVSAIVIGAVLVATFVRVVDPGLANPRISALIAALTVMLTGTIVGFTSPGQTVRETGIAGFGLLLVTFATLGGVLGHPVPVRAILLGLLLVPALAMLGGIIGETLQGTLARRTEKAVDWLWVVTGVAIGWTLNIYVIFVGSVLFGDNAALSIASFWATFFLMGFIVGYRSPDVRLLEPAIAAFIMVFLDAVVLLSAYTGSFSDLPLEIAFGGGTMLGFVGAIIAERIQERMEKARAAPTVPAPH